MGSDQHFCLKWNNFHSNITASFEYLRDHEDFVDVTIACEGRSLKAHKIVLSACSPYFKNLLKQNPCQHPIIILRDVAFPDLAALLSFVYQGEVYVSQERLPAFLRTAEMLHIKGLTEQNKQHRPSTTAPITIRPPSCTTVLQTTHDQGIVNNRVSGSSVTSCSPRCSTPPSPRKPISPPLKKRRSATTTTTITPLPSPNTPTSSSCASPRMEVFSATTDGGLLEGGSALAAALTKPFPHRSDLIVTQSTRLPNVTRGQQQQHPPHSDCMTKIIKRETEEEEEDEEDDIREIKEEEEDDDLEDEDHQQAVNLVMEGTSILRQRIQGFQMSPVVGGHNNNNNGRVILSSHEESSMDEGFIGAEGVINEAEERDKGSPMVIRSPLAGLLPMDAPGLYGGAGTSGSLVHHDSSQDMVLNLSTGCSPKDTKKWPSRQPVNCQYCGVRISMAFNLRNHVKRCKMRPFTPNTGQSIRSSPVPCVPQTDQQSGQPEETPEDPSFDSGRSHVSALSQGVPQQVLPVDTHQLVPPGGQTPPATPCIIFTSQWGSQQ